MSKYAFLGLAAILTAAGAAASNYANGSTEEPQGAPPEEPKRRGRPTGSTNKAPEDNGGAAVSGEDRLAANKLLIKPLIDAAHGELVKKAVAVYSKTGMKDIPEANQAAFEADIKKLLAEKIAGDEY